MRDQPLHRIFGLLLVIFLSWHQPAVARDQAGAFDFYVLSLSWSPTFCLSDQGARSDQQCQSRRPQRFVVHGLWPQSDTGYPEFCDSREPDRVPRALGEAMFDIMPSMGLIGHQWRKHGTCSGLTQEQYLDLTRDAFERVTVPPRLAQADRPLTLSTDEIEGLFTAANPGMDRRAITASCDDRRLEEIRICLTKDLEFRDCGALDARGCRMRQVTLPAPR